MYNLIKSRKYLDTVYIFSTKNNEEKICYAAHSDSYSAKSLNVYFAANPNGTIKIVKIKKVIIFE